MSLYEGSGAGKGHRVKKRADVPGSSAAPNTYSHIGRSCPEACMQAQNTVAHTHAYTWTPSPMHMCPPLLYMQVCSAPHVSAHFTHPCEAPHTGRHRGMVLLQRPEGDACACLGQGRDVPGVKGQRLAVPSATCPVPRRGGCMALWENREAARVPWPWLSRSGGSCTPVTALRCDVAVWQEGPCPCLSRFQGPCPVLRSFSCTPASPAPRFHTSLLGKDPENHRLGARD